MEAGGSDLSFGSYLIDQIKLLAGYGKQVAFATIPVHIED